MLINCPSCGANLKGVPKCSYCGNIYLSLPKVKDKLSHAYSQNIDRAEGVNYPRINLWASWLNESTCSTLTLHWL